MNEKVKLNYNFLFYLYIYSPDSQESDVSANTYGKQLPRPASGDVKIVLFYIHQRPHTTTRSPMSVKIGSKTCILVVR